ARAIGERQKGERAVAHEALPRRRLVRPGGSDRCDDRRLAIAGDVGGDARRLAHARLGAIGPDDQARREPAAAGEDADPRVGDLERFEGGGLEMPAGLRERPEQRPLQELVLGDVAQVRLTDIGRVELEHRIAVWRDALVPHPHALVSRYSLGRHAPPRASALFAGGNRSNMRSPRLRSRPAPGRVSANNLTRPSVKRTSALRSRERHCSKRRSSSVEPASPGAPVTASASIAASRRPRLNPWPATGCSAWAALPISTARVATVVVARVSFSG